MSELPRKTSDYVSYLAHKVISVIGPRKAGDSFSNWPKNGGQKSLFVKFARKSKTDCTTLNESNIVEKMRIHS